MSRKPKVEMSSVWLRDSMAGAQSASSGQVGDEVRQKARAKSHRVL